MFGDETGMVWSGNSGTNFSWNSDAIFPAFSPGSIEYSYDLLTAGIACAAGHFRERQAWEHDVGGPISPVPNLSVSGNGTTGGTGALTATVTSDGSPLPGETVTSNSAPPSLDDSDRWVGDYERGWCRDASRHQPEGFRRSPRHRRGGGERSSEFELHRQQPPSAT